MRPAAFNRSETLRLSLTDKIRLVAALPAIIAMLLLAVSLVEFQMSGESIDRMAAMRESQLKANLLQMRARACLLSEALFVADAGLRCPSVGEVRDAMDVYMGNPTLVGRELVPELVDNIEAMNQLAARRSELEMQRLGIAERLYESGRAARAALQRRGAVSGGAEVLLDELEQAGMTGGEHVPSALVVNAFGRLAQEEEARGHTEAGQAHEALIELRSLAATVGGIETEAAVLYARASAMIGEKWNPSLFANLQQIQATSQAERRRNLYNLLGIAILATLLAVGLGIYLSRTLSKPFERLRAALRNEHASEEEMADDLSGLADAHERLSEARRRQKQMDERLVLLGRALDEAPSGIVISSADPSQPPVYVNRRFLEIVGLSEDEMMSRSVTEIAGGTAGDATLEDIKRTVMGGGTANIVHVDHRPDGARFHHRKSISGIVQDGRITNYIGVHDDVSDEVEKAQRLEDALHRTQIYAQALDSAASGVVITDPRQPDNPIVYVNRRFTEITGYAPEEVIGRNCRFLNGPERNQPELDKLRQALVSTVEVDVQLRNYRKDGSLFHNRLRITELHDAAGVVTHFIGVQNDVTAEVEAQERQDRLQAELVSASRLAGMGEVAAGVLHNVGNVLNSLGVSAETLQAKLRGSRVSNLARAVAMLNEHRERIGEFLTEDPRGRKLPDYFRDLAAQLEKENAESRTEVESIRHNLDHVVRTIASQQSHAKQGGITEHNDLADVLDVAASLTFMDPSSEIRVEKDFGNVPPLMIDRHRLMQVLINLMRNARHAVLGPEIIDERRIRIRLWREEHAEGPRAMMSVRDSGVGISAENLEKIFNFGFTTKKTGNGYGLHSSANLMAEMGGGITVSSDGPGRGACFTLWLPIPEASKRQGVA